MEQNRTDFSDDTTALTGNQAAALPYLVASPTLSGGARLASIARSTLYRWMDDAEFRTTLERMRAETADLAHNELKGLMLKSVLVLAEAMEDSNPRVRVRAAHAAFSVGLKVHDLEELRKRVDRVDEAVHLWAKRNTRL